ncbi:MAG: phosphatase PAP2 family protein [Bacteroidales bacterium]|nr:phosphatase PAP2 family protein [Bacteroidales bacterium]
MYKFIFICLLFPGCFSFGQTNQFPYQLSFKKELIFISSGLSLNGIYYLIKKDITKLSAYEIPELKITDINRFDRSATEKYNTKLNETSEILTNLGILSPSLIMVSDLKKKEWGRFFTIGLMYCEAQLLNYGLKQNIKVLIPRNRPYLYNSTIKISERDELARKEDSYKSFYSGHTTAIFCSAVFISKVFSDLYPESKIKLAIWGITLAGASITAYFRYASGWHYPSDIITGAIIGSTIGYLIPVLHYKKNNNFYLTLKNPGSLGISYHF